MFVDDHIYIDTSPVQINVSPEAEAVPVNRLTCRPIHKNLEVPASEQIKELLYAGINQEANEPSPWCAASTFIKN